MNEETIAVCINSEDDDDNDDDFEYEKTYQLTCDCSPSYSPTA